MFWSVWSSTDHCVHNFTFTIVRMLLYFLLVHLSSTVAEEQVIAIDHMGLVFEDAFNNSYLANQGYKGRYNNDTFYSG